MKCKYCSFSHSDRKVMVDHIKHNHRFHVTTIHQSSFNLDSNDIQDSLILDGLILESLDSLIDSSPSYSDDSSYSGGGGDFGGGGASGDWVKNDSIDTSDPSPSSDD